jgi:cytochrome c-type biogenesis protein CcmF
MVMIFIGLAGQAFNKEAEKELPIGSTISIGKYDLLLQSMDRKQEKNYVADRMIVEVMKDQKPVMMLYPERRNFPTNQESGTMVAIYSTLREDLYVVYAGMNPQTNLPTVHAFINPLVKWVWWGGMVVVMGTIVALIPNRAAVMVLARAEAPSGAREVSGLQPAQVTLREGHD